jgi:uncharacterized protein (UPF0264 family)
VRLLVSVSTAEEAEAAIAGGADIVDAKDSSRGALSPVSAERLAVLAGVCRGRVPFSAALGDDGDPPSLEARAARCASLGVAFVKVGFPPSLTDARLRDVLDAVHRGVSGHRRPPAVVAVAYADAPAITVEAVLRAAVSAGARGVLLDTVDKSGPGLTALFSADRLRSWTDSLRSMHLWVALAGQLTIDDLDSMVRLEPDIVGVRGAACEGGRMGTVSAERVSMLRTRCGAGRRQAPRPRAAPVAARA